jgi:UDP-N-acetylglucosamine 2-epimerase (non-hydrolysing)
MNKNHRPTLRTACITGTRPEIIKMFPVVQRLRENQIDTTWIASGQHTELAEQTYTAVGLSPDVNLPLNRENSDLSSLSGKMIEAFGKHFKTKNYQLILVHGDTATALAAGLAAFYCGITVGHVEAGLRCPSVMEPFPEEAHRRLLARISHWHFAPTPLAQEQLLQEQASGHIILTGNTGLDALQITSQRISENPHLVSEQCRYWFDKTHKKTILVTLHRRENWENGVQHVCKALKNWLAMSPNHAVYWAVHANPALKNKIEQELADLKLAHEMIARFKLSEPLNYLDMTHAIQNCFALATDSGGLQEEASLFQTPVLVLRNTTERPEAIKAGYAELVGCTIETITNALYQLTLGVKKIPTTITYPFGDGRAAQRIVHHLHKHLVTNL